MKRFRQAALGQQDQASQSSGCEDLFNTHTHTPVLQATVCKIRNAARTNGLIGFRHAPSMSRAQ